jgi:hypothetical protein
MAGPCPAFRRDIAAGAVVPKNGERAWYRRLANHAKTEREERNNGL